MFRRHGEWREFLPARWTTGAAKGGAVTDRLAAAAAIPMARPNIGALERELVAQVLASDTLAMGPFTERFEQTLAAMTGRRHGIAVSSGTAGLHLAIRAVGIGARDEVITTPFSFVASANCILFEGARPVFVDIEEETLGMDPDLIDGAATDQTRAIVAVDVFGAPCQIDRIAVHATREGWHLIEDSCEALGSSLDGRPLGSFGDVSVFAFYPNKQITTGEGGMVVTDDDAIARAMRSMRNQGRDEDGTWLRHVQLGYNYRIDELSAAVGVAQLQRYAELRAGRDRVVAAYGQVLAEIDWLTIPLSPPRSDVDWFVYVVRVQEGVDRDAMIRHLAEFGVPARPYFSPIHLQPFYREQLGFAPGAFPVTERVAASTMALPFSSQHSDAEVERVADALRRAGAAQGLVG